MNVMRIEYFIWIASLCFLAAGCREGKKAADAEKMRTDTVAIDACALLTSAEIEAIQGSAVQGSAVKDAKSSAKTEGGITTSQCYFTLARSADSIVLTISSRANNAQARGPRQVWNETFHRVAKKKTGRDGKEKITPRPEKIEGLGDEAFWTGLRFGGTLHVLKGETNIRISVGGPGGEDTQLQRLKSLAEIILPRLQPR